MKNQNLSELKSQLSNEADLEVSPERTPDISIIMGSDSDLSAMKGAHKALDTLGFGEQVSFGHPPDGRFSYETYVVSAHRTPSLMYRYAKTAADRGIEVIIAGAGGKSADLPNMTASLAYPLPVIGVPVQEKSVDSVIGMPTGAPIVAVDAGKSFNAALSAVQILARGYPELSEALQSYQDSLVSDVAETAVDLHDFGVDEFMQMTDE